MPSSTATPGPHAPAAHARGGFFFRRLFLTTLAAALPVVGLFAWWLQASLQQAQQDRTASVLMHSSETARRLESTLARLDVVADVLLAREEVRTMDTSRCDASLKDLPRVDPLIQNVGVFDLDGRALCLSRRLAAMPPTFRNSPWFRQLLARESRVLTSPYWSPASQRHVLSMGVPVRDAQGRRIGILGLSLDLERLSATLQGERLPAGASVAVVSPDGMMVARSPEPTRWIGRQVPAPLLATAPAHGASGVFEGVGVDGVPRAIGYAAVGTDGWRVYTGVPKAHFEALRRDSTLHALGMLAAALLLGVAASWLGARWLAQPLQHLAGTARRLAEGDDQARADEAQPGEVGELGAEFNHMVRSLVHSRDVERASTARFMQLFNVIPVAAAVIDAATCRLLEINDGYCREHGVDRETALGQPPQALGIALDGQAEQRFIAGMQAHAQVRGLAATVTSRDGVERHVLVSGERIQWSSCDAWLCVQVDVTQARRAEQLQAANTAKTEFLSRMSHELRTPLNAILGLTGLLRIQAGPLLPRPAAQQLELLQRAGEQLKALIDDVLDVARIESGHLALTLQALDAAALVDEALLLGEAAAQQAGVRLRRSPAGGAGPEVLADATRLRQVLMNLVSNAIKYNRPGGEVEVRLAREGALACIEVRDTGIGMSAAERESLFQPFNRLGREHGPIPGTGIGLVLTRSLVQLLGGALDVHSVQGQGTTVTVRLPGPPLPPAVDAQAGDASTDSDAGEDTEPPDAARGSVTAPGPGPAPVPVPTADLRPSPCGEVLYIEDNEVNAMIVEQLLADWPQVRLTVAPDGESGLRLARAACPDVLLLDLQLPDMDGLEVLRRFRADQSTCATPVIVLSASAMPAEVTAARAAGAQEFWSKPFDFAAFLEGLRQRLPSAPPSAPTAAEPNSVSLTIDRPV